MRELIENTGEGYMQLLGNHLGLCDTMCDDSVVSF